MYAVAPSSLKLKWDNAVQYESFFLSQNYQGGVDERGNRNQLNQTTATQTLTLTIDNQFEYVEIDEFLTENYGNWKIPKKFNYTQGLAGEYKNLIN